MFEKALEEFEKIDILVNCAGINRRTPAEKYLLRKIGITLSILI